MSNYRDGGMNYLSEMKGWTPTIQVPPSSTLIRILQGGAQDSTNLCIAKEIAFIQQFIIYT